MVTHLSGVRSDGLSPVLVELERIATEILEEQGLVPLFLCCPDLFVGLNTCGDATGILDLDRLLPCLGVQPVGLGTTVYLAFSALALAP